MELWFFLIRANEEILNCVRGLIWKFAIGLRMLVGV